MFRWENISLGGETVKKIGQRKAVIARNRTRMPRRAPQDENDDMGELRQALSQAAQIYFSEATATVERDVPFSRCHFEDVGARLGVSIEVLQDWLRSLPGVFAQDVSWNECMITQEGVKKLIALAEMKEQGRSDEDISHYLNSHTESSSWQDRIDEVLEVLDRVRAQRDRDRHMLLKELGRNREEIQHLRHELVAAIPRRARRRSFWSRLVGS